jgi:flagellar FliJ protein
MPFRFSLEPVLRLRLSYERLERLRLLAIAAMLVRVKQEIAAAAREEAAARNTRQQMLARGAAAAEIQLGVSAERARARRNRELFDRVASLERRHSKQARAYQIAKRNREIVENLRERKLHEYRREQNRREQQRIDELYVLRRLTPSE